MATATRLVRLRGATAAAVALALLAAGCSGPSSAPSPDTRTASESTASADELAATDVVTGLAAPWGVVALGDGSQLVSQRDQASIVRVEEHQIRVVRELPEVAPGGEGGLLGLALSPDGETLFAYHTAAEDNRIATMAWDGQTLGEPRVILDGIPKAGRHTGGGLILAPGTTGCCVTR